MSGKLEIRTGLRAGDVGRIVALHGTVYPDNEFGLRFEAFVARTLAEFVLDADGAGKVWLVERDGQLKGCTAIVHRPDNVAQLRWVLLTPGCRGRGVGRRLVEAAIDYCRDRGFASIYLETTSGLDASSTLYRALGFEVVDEHPEELWAGIRPLIVMQLRLDGGGR